MSQRLPLYQVDAFASRTFEGNPAAVVPLEEWPEDHILQNIALENNLSETAFFVRREEDYHLRWFTPALEVDLCGHATLASAHVLFSHLDHPEESIRFHTRSGLLTVTREQDEYIMIFPVDNPRPYDLSLLPPGLMGPAPDGVFDADYLLTTYPKQSDIETLTPDFRTMATLPWLGVIATAPADDPSVDFVSRFFCPKAGIDEDPVTGSAHTILAPYWAERLHKNELKARQISPRGGSLTCLVENNRVLLRGKAITYMEGKINFS
ncbi:MAG: PhzF family phenazine biosynthesis protein [Cyclobacteriaceae bacterium]